MRAYSIDLRERVPAAGADGTTAAEVADTSGVSESWARRVRRRHAAAGEVGPRGPARSGPAPVARHDRLRPPARDHPGLSAAAYHARRGVGGSALTAWRAPRRLGLTFKKRAPGRPRGTARTSPAGGTGGGTR